LIFARGRGARVISSGDKSRAGFQGRRLDRQGALRSGCSGSGRHEQWAIKPIRVNFIGWHTLSHRERPLGSRVCSQLRARGRPEGRKSARMHATCASTRALCISRAYNRAETRQLLSPSDRAVSPTALTRALYVCEDRNSRNERRVQDRSTRSVSLICIKVTPQSSWVLRMTEQCAERTQPIRRYSVASLAIKTLPLRIHAS